VFSNIFVMQRLQATDVNAMQTTVFGMYLGDMWAVKSPQKLPDFFK
jgi:hypothetical protein